MGTDADAPQFVFGYGSLSAGAPWSQTVHLVGFRRAWNVAMDNTVDLPGYKYYRDAAGGRPAVFVTFLNLIAGGDAVNGIVFEVTAGQLAALDARERNYRRVDVTERVAEVPPGRIWTYLGSPDARARYERGRSEGSAVVSREYHDRVLRSFGLLGQEAMTEFAATTDPPACPIRELQRVDLVAPV